MRIPMLATSIILLGLVVPATLVQASLSSAEVASAPQNLAINVAGQDVHLSWDTPEYVFGAGISHYNVYRWVTPGWVLVGTPTATAFIDAEAVAGDALSASHQIYRVSSASSSGEGASTDIINIRHTDTSCNGLVLHIPQGEPPSAEVNGICLINQSTQSLPEPYRTAARSILYFVWDSL